MRIFILFLFFNFSSLLKSQDTLYARKVIKKLTSKECFGRGYLKNGLANAASFIVSELKASGADPLLAGSYYQPFNFNVNTFPDKMLVKINGKLLEPGADYIVSPESGSLKGKFKMVKKDSVTFLSQESPLPLVLSVKKKLTFSVATHSSNVCEIDLLNKNLPQEISSVEINVKSKVIDQFVNRNICASINGTVNNDTMIVYAAHYDHLGGMGKKVFFPGANDNASGVSVLLNLVKFYKKNQPKYKTVFIFFAGEEAGLIGSKYFVDNKTVDLKKIKFLINLDLLGTGDDGIMLVNGAIHTKEFDMMIRINTETGLVKEIKKRGKAKNSDHYWFTEAGVPCFFIYTLGGTTSYHDIYDVEKKLPLTDYVDVFKLVTQFVERL